MTNSTKTLELLVKFLATTNGRDKTCRFIQYFLRFVKAVLLHLNRNRKLKAIENIADRMSSISSQLSLTRKVLRFGRSIGTGYSLYKLWVAFLKDEDRRKGKQLVVFIVKTIDYTISTLDYLLDHFLWAVRVGAIKKPSWFETADWLSDVSWLAGSILGIILSLLSLSEVKRPPKEATDDQEAERLHYKYKKEVQEHMLDISKYLLDIPISVGSLKPGSFGNGVQALSGTLGALIGGYQGWPSN